MRKILPVLVIGILVLSGLGAVVVSESEEESYESEIVLFSRPIIHEQDMYVTIDLLEASSNSIEVGKPSLPVVTEVFTFPIGTILTEIDVMFSEEIDQYITKPILPAPEPQIVSTIHSSKPTVKTNILETYDDIEIYPESRYTYRTGAGLKDGEHVVYLTVYLHPVQYVPASNMIYYSENAKIDISYTIPVNPVNYPDEYDLLVIAPEEFSDEFYNIDSEFDTSFVDYKNNHDVSTIIVTLNEIYNAEYFPVEGIDDQEKIKYFIKNAIENWGITYVILVGSWVELEDEPPDSQYTKFPIRKAYISSGQYEEWFPSDLYYADVYDSEMQFSDWDADDDGKYAEYKSSISNDMSAVDMYPDVYLGRLPCVNENEVEDIIHKILYYEIHNKMTNKIIQIGGDTFPGDHENINEGEYANKAVLDRLSGYTTTQLWATNGALTKQNIADGFKDNVDFVDFSGHGSWGGWSTHPPGDADVWIPPKTLISPYTGFLYVDFDMYQINNPNKFPVVVYNACSCNKYSDHPSCMSWSTVKRANGGGIASFGASGIGYGGHGTGEIKRVWGWMEVKLFTELYNTKLLGKVWANAITGYANSFELNDADYKTILEMSMFGDPTVSIEDGDDPKTKSVTVNKPLYYQFLDRLANHFPLFEKLSLIFEKFI